MQMIVDDVAVCRLNSREDMIWEFNMLAIIISAPPPLWSKLIRNRMPKIGSVIYIISDRPSIKSKIVNSDDGN
jgi:hypothetical protein